MLPTKRTTTLSVAALAAIILAAIALQRLTAPGPKGASGERLSTDGSAANLPGALSPIAVDAGSGQKRNAVASRPSTWTVSVLVNGESQAADARLVAERLGDAVDAEGPEGGESNVLKADSRAHWQGVEPGFWSLAVHAKGYPAWRRTVSLAPGEHKRTVVRLGLPATVIGTVLDADGAPCAQHFVGFVKESGEAPRSPIKWLSLPHSRTGPGGGFRAELPEPGRYRLFVGYGGRVLLEDDAIVDLEPGVERRVDVVIPSATRLVLAAQEANGVLLSVPYGVSVYRLSSLLDLERPPVPTPERTVPDPTDPSLSEEERGEMVRAIEAEKMTVDPAELARRRSVVPKGWRVDRSALLGPDGTLVLSHLPVGEELRFAARRGSEVFRVEGSASVHPGATVRVTLKFPAEGSSSGAAVPAVSATPELVGTGGIPRAVGATWD